MFLPCVRAFNAFRNRTPSFSWYSLKAVEFECRGAPWITVSVSTGGRRTIFHVPILVGSRIFLIVFRWVEAIAAGLDLRLFSPSFLFVFQTEADAPISLRNWL